MYEKGGKLGPALKKKQQPTLSACAKTSFSESLYIPCAGEIADAAELAGNRETCSIPECSLTLPEMQDFKMTEILVRMYISKEKINSSRSVF